MLYMTRAHNSASPLDITNIVSKDPFLKLSKFYNTMYRSMNSCECIICNSLPNTSITWWYMIIKHCVYSCQLCIKYLHISIICLFVALDLRRTYGFSLPQILLYYSKLKVKYQRNWKLYFILALQTGLSTLNWLQDACSEALDIVGNNHKILA